MFQKLSDQQLKKKATLKTALLTKLKTAADRCMPGFASIADVVFPKKAPVTIVHLENHLELYLVGDVPVIFKLGDGSILPHLYLVMQYPGLCPRIYVDEGAFRPLLRGADLMAPGIKGKSVPFEAGAIVAIYLLGTEQPFAVGVAKVSSEEAESMTGPAVQICHVLRDSLWMKRNGV